MFPAALILDMDGLMLDTEPVYKTAWQQAATELGYTITDAEYVRFTGRPAPVCEELLVELLGATFPLARFRTRASELWTATVCAGVRAKPGLEELLAFAGCERLPTAIATSTARESADLTLRHAGLRDRFHIVVTGDEVVLGKPAPDIYLEAARRLGVDPRGCVVLEDSEAGVLSASAAGMRTILVPEGAPSDKAARAASCIVPSLHEARHQIGRWKRGREQFLEPDLPDRK